MIRDLARTIEIHREFKMGLRKPVRPSSKQRILTRDEVKI